MRHMSMSSLLRLLRVSRFSTTTGGAKQQTLSKSAPRVFNSCKHASAHARTEGVVDAGDGRNLFFFILRLRLAPGARPRVIA